MTETPMPLWEVFIRNRSGAAQACGQRACAGCHHGAAGGGDVYTRRGESVSTGGAVERHRRLRPGQKDELFEPTGSKIYRHPTFYKVPDEVGHM